MRVPVIRRWRKARRVARLIVSAQYRMKGIEHLREWALASGTGANAALSMLLTGDGLAEIRCEIGSTTRIDPDDGVEVILVPSSYVAAVRIRNVSLDPELPTLKFTDWIRDSEYDAGGEIEVEFAADIAAGYELSVPIRRKRRRRYLEI